MPRRFSPQPLAYFLLAFLPSYVISYVPMMGEWGRPKRVGHSFHNHHGNNLAFASALASTSESIADVDAPVSFIDTELRGAAMKLHTKMQAPKQGKLEAPKIQPYVTTHADYLAFLVASQHVYAALEEATNTHPALETFRNTGMERTKGLENDIFFMMEEYDLPRPAVGKTGFAYAERIKKLAAEDKIPEFMCHYYNFTFAHTAGGRMIGKRFSELLFNNRTLEFYKWDGDINEIKAVVKANIEEMVLSWSPEEKKQCVKATGAAFKGGGGINSCLRGKD